LIHTQFTVSGITSQILLYKEDTRLSPWGWGSSQTGGPWVLICACLMRPTLLCNSNIWTNL